MEMWGEKKKLNESIYCEKDEVTQTQKKHGLNYLINSGQVFDGFLFL